jgi:hypothetical protein
MSTFRDNSVVEGETYSYVISAYYQGQYTGESKLSNTVVYTPLPIQELPYREDFEEIGHGWKIKNNVEGFQWGDAAGLAMNTTNLTKFLGANSVAAGNGTICSDFAITPRLNLRNKAKVYIHFDYTLKRWQQLDHLKVFCRRSTYESWIPVIDLPVSPIGGQYRWKKYNLEIPADAYNGEAQIGFQYDDGNDLGFGAAIDNVVVDELATSGIEDNISNITVSVFPNPASENATIDITGANGSRLTMKLIGSDGKTIWSEVRSGLYNGQEAVNLTGLAKGIYYVVIESDAEVIVRSLVKK